MKHAILGLGAIGGLLGTALAHLGEDVTALVRTESRPQYTGMVRLERPYETIEAQVHIKTGLSGPVDVLWIAVKEHQLVPAMSGLVGSRRSIGVVVPLLNGIEHVAVLRSLFTHDQVIPATILVSSERVASERFIQRSPFANLAIGSRAEERLTSLRAGLEMAGFSVEFNTDEITMLWRKLAFLAPLALVGAASGKNKQEIFEDQQWRIRLEAALLEACSVATADGARVSRTDILSLLQEVPPAMRSSLQKDLAAGLLSEVDAIGGAIIRSGERHEVAAPIIQELVNEITGRLKKSN